MNYLEEYYNNFEEDSRLIPKSRQPEFLTTMKYIKKYLTADSKILEIGAGSGRYSRTLADMGYKVDSVELIQRNIDAFKSKLNENQQINIYKGNACNLNFLKSDTYDIVLLLGPMYHLFTDEDKHKAVSEAIRVAKRNAVIFAAYCNLDTCVYRNFAERTMIEKVNKGIFDTETFKENKLPNTLFLQCRKEDVDKIMSSYNVQRLHYVGVDMLTSFFGESFNDFTKEEFELYMKYHYQICERKDMIGMSFHILDIFKKL